PHPVPEFRQPHAAQGTAGPGLARRRCRDRAKTPQKPFNGCVVIKYRGSSRAWRTSRSWSCAARQESRRRTGRPWRASRMLEGHDGGRMVAPTRVNEGAPQEPVTAEPADTATAGVTQAEVV